MNNTIRSSCVTGALAVALLGAASLGAGCFYEEYHVDEALGGGGGGGADAGSSTGSGATSCAKVNDLVPIACNQDGPVAIAVDATNIYWANKGSGTVVQMGRVLGVPITVAENETGPCGIAAHAGVVYWRTRGGELKHVNLNDPMKKVVVDESGIGNNCALAASGPRVFYARDNGGNGFDIVERPIIGGATGVLASSPEPISMSAAGNFVVWIDNIDLKAYRARADVPNDRKALDVAQPCDAVTFANGVFVTVNKPDGEIHFVDPVGAATVLQINKQASPCRIAAGAAGLFWIDSQAGTLTVNPLMVVDQPTPLVKGPKGACSMAVDNDTVFWTECSTKTGAIFSYKYVK